MNNELTIAIHNLCIRYYQMRITENDVRRYDDTNVGYNKEVRDVLIKAFKINEKLYDEQYELVQKLIKKENGI